METEAKNVINELLRVQWEPYEYEDFFLILKHRLRKFTGNDEVIFYGEEEVVSLLKEHNLVSISH